MACSLPRPHPHLHPASCAVLSPKSPHRRYPILAQSDPGWLTQPGPPRGGTGRTWHSGCGPSARCRNEEEKVRNYDFTVEHYLSMLGLIFTLPDTSPGLPVPDANGLVVWGTQNPRVLLEKEHMNGYVPAIFSMFQWQTLVRHQELSGCFRLVQHIANYLYTTN